MYRLERFLKNKYCGDNYSLPGSFQGRTAPISHLASRVYPTTLKTTTHYNQSYNGGNGFHNHKCQGCKKREIFNGGECIYGEEYVTEPNKILPKQ
jgi:hypothetical protein